MDASRERLITCPAGRKIVLHHLMQKIADIAEEPFVQLSSVSVVGMDAKIVPMIPGEEGFFRCSQCISSDIRGCQIITKDDQVY